MIEDVFQLANESRTVQPPARRYCSGGPTLPEHNLYISPSCTIGSVQTPMLNSSVIAYEARAVGNLSFCCKSNYTAVLPVGTNLTALDLEAKYLYDELVKGAIGRYDCRNFYPFMTCSHCLYAYRSWVCAITFPMACATEDGRYEALRMCDLVCWEVMRKCPVELGFSCPASANTDALYAAPQPIDPFTIAKEIKAGAAGCNPMDYSVASGVTVVVTSAASSFEAPLATALLALVLAVLVA